MQQVTREINDYFVEKVTETQVEIKAIAIMKLDSSPSAHQLN